MAPEQAETRAGGASGIPESRRIDWASAAILVGIGILLFALGMTEQLNHDEHQFIASGALWARRGLLPYRDYPYFHLPYLVFLYGVLFKLSDHLLLSARLFTIACAWGTVVLVFAAAQMLFAGAAPGQRRLIASAAVALLIFNRIFTVTSARTWNHDFPTLLMMLALVLLWRSRRTGRITLWAYALAGILMGIATGARLTFAPPAAVFALLPFVTSDTPPARRGGQCGAYVLGLALALAPLLLVFRQAPRAFVFDNLGYPTLNSAYRIETGYQKSMTGPEKLLYIVRDLLRDPGTAALALLLVVTVALHYRHAAPARRREPLSLAVGFLTILLCAVLVGSFAPAPLFLQYFYTPLMLIVLLILHLGAELPAQQPARNLWMQSLYAATVVTLVCGGVWSYRGITRLWDVHAWVPVSVHRIGQEIRGLAGPRTTVVTATPIFPLEGRLDIFEPYATGDFAMRVGAMISENDEPRLKWVDLEDLPAALKTRQPYAVLTGLEPKLDGPLIEAAGATNDQPHALENKLELRLHRGG